MQKRVSEAAAVAVISPLCSHRAEPGLWKAVTPQAGCRRCWPVAGSMTAATVPANTSVPRSTMCSLP